MTLRDFFWGLGEIFQDYLLVFLQNDFPITWFMNTALVVLGFVGLFTWLNMQRKFNAKAAADSNQRK